MPTNPDVMVIVRILDQEGFGALAGELLTEISLGRELDVDDGQGPQSRESDIRIKESDSLQEDPNRESIPEDQQLDVLLNFLRVRLVEPVRFLAEAEHIASEFVNDIDRAAGQEAPQTTSGLPVRITFADPDNSGPTGLVRAEEAGGKESADRLDAVLTKISQQAV